MPGCHSHKSARAGTEERIRWPLQLASVPPHCHLPAVTQSLLHSFAGLGWSAFTLAPWIREKMTSCQHSCWGTISGHWQNYGWPLCPNRECLWGGEHLCPYIMSSSVKSSMAQVCWALETLEAFGNSRLEMSTDKSKRVPAMEAEWVSPSVVRGMAAATW